MSNEVQPRPSIVTSVTVTNPGPVEETVGVADDPELILQGALADQLNVNGPLPITVADNCGPVQFEIATAGAIISVLHWAKLFMEVRVVRTKVRVRIFLIAVWF